MDYKERPGKLFDGSKDDNERLAIFFIRFQLVGIKKALLQILQKRSYESLYKAGKLAFSNLYGWYSFLI